MLFAIPCLLHFMISYVHFFCSFYFITDWTDLYYGRMNQQQVFFHVKWNLFNRLLLYYHSYFRLSVSKSLDKRCFNFVQNCNLRSRSRAGEGTVVERAALWRISKIFWGIGGEEGSGNSWIRSCLGISLHGHSRP